MDVIRLVFASYLIMTIIVLIKLLIIYLCVLLGWCFPPTYDDDHCTDQPADYLPVCGYRLVFALYLMMTIIVLINLLIIYLCVVIGWCLPRTA